VSGTLYLALATLIGLSPLYSCCFRSRLRAHYGLKEKPCPDCCVHWFCEPCALCQEYRELQHRGFDMSIGTSSFLLPPFDCFRRRRRADQLRTVSVLGLQGGTPTW
jgi:hypothetical protein